MLAQAGAVLPGVFAGGAAAIGTAVIGFKGMGDAVKALMRSTLAPGSYRAWRKRVRQFGERRAHYK